MSGTQRNLDLGVIGNSEVAALVDADAHDRLVLPAAARRRPGVLRPARLGSRRGRAGTVRDRAVDRVEASSATCATRRSSRPPWATCSGNRLRVVDFCPRFRARGRIFRPAMVVRLLEPLAGRPMVRMRLRPRFEHGAVAPQVTRGSHHIAYRGRQHALPPHDQRLAERDRRESPCVIDGPLALILGPDQTIEESPLALAQSFLDQTRRTGTTGCAASRFRSNGRRP